jgi:hypothetical protein
MKNFLVAALALTALGVTAAAHADEYNAVPAGDAQYAQCKSYSTNKYSGGGARSPIDGQTKVEAFCTCMWNETPDNFRGNLASFAETTKGAAMNKVCEKYSDWSSE